MRLLRAKRERDFLVARYVAPGRWHGDTGLSSDALLREAITGKPADELPMDHDDLGRCERMFAAAPKHLRKRMAPRLVEFRSIVAKRHPLPDDPNWFV